MYLNRMPRYKNTTAKEVNAIEGYLDWLKEKKKEVNMQIVHLRNGAVLTKVNFRARM